MVNVAPILPVVVEPVGALTALHAQGDVAVDDRHSRWEVSPAVPGDDHAVPLVLAIDVLRAPGMGAGLLAAHMQDPHPVRDVDVLGGLIHVAKDTDSYA